MKQKRRLWVGAVCVLTLVFSSVTMAFGAQEQETTATSAAKAVIYYTNDIHGAYENMAKINRKKAGILYSYLDSSALFKPTVQGDSRSIMNVPFVTGNEELDAKFVKEAAAAGFVNLKGHRTVGGMRASFYNAMPVEGVEALVEFMKKFEAENA